MKSIQFNMSLKQKVILLFMVPTLVMGTLSIVRSYESWDERNNAESAVESLEIVKKISILLHEVQKERGRSVLFLAGQVGSDKLLQQHQLTTNAFTEMERFAKDHLDKRLSDLSQSFMPQIEALRSSVEKKNIGKNEAFNSYSKLVETLMDKQKVVEHSVDVVGVPSMLKDISILEAAKEAGGRLRATSLGILALNQPIASEDIEKLIFLLAGVEDNLRSPGLNLPEDVAQKVETLLASTEWKQFRGVVTKIIQRASTGQYGEDPGQFFETATVAVDQMLPIVQQQVSQTEALALLVYDKSNERFLEYSIFSILSLILIISVGTWVTRNILNQLTEVSKSLLESNIYIDREAQGLSTLSSSLVDSAKREADSLQKTASAAEEIGALVKRTSDNTATSRVAVEQCVTTANRGLEIVKAMGQVSTAMAAMNEQTILNISNSNQQLEKINALFKTIEDKTKVINDIVFQTRLLSFNASVEAARAGENGKGFAVVAEEVGRLAHMSGSSAGEISSLIASVSSEISGIVAAAKADAASVESQVKQKTGELLTNVNHCNEIFKEISNSVAHIAQQVREISVAAEEQEQGVNQINHSILDVNRMSDTNVKSASAVNIGATNMRSQMSYFKTSVRSLVSLLSGNSMQSLEEGVNREPTSEFQWGPQYCMGVDKMDEEHEILVSKINVVIRQLNAGSPAATVRMSFLDLGAYIKEHFDDEEQMMEQIGYTGLEGHRKVHQRLIQQVGEFQRALELGSLNTNDLMTFLKDWLISHIGGTDSLYVSTYHASRKNQAA